MYQLNSALEQFLDHLLLEKSLSPATLSAYSTDLRQYAVFLIDLNINSLEAIELAHLDNFVRILQHHGLSAASITRKISALRGFHKFCLNEGLTENDPTEFLQMRQPLRRLPEVIPSELIDKLLCLPSEFHPAGIRDRALLELIYGCGLRISEAVNLTLGNLHLKDRLIRVLGKGSKTRFVPLGSLAHNALIHYLESVRPGFADCASEDKGFIFLNQRGNPLSRGGAFVIIKSYLKRAFPNQDYSPHTLRHSFATHLLEGGAGIRTVQEMLGHVSIATTQIYTHLDRSHLVEVIKTYHPRG